MKSGARARLPAEEMELCRKRKSYKEALSLNAAVIALLQYNEIFKLSTRKVSRAKAVVPCEANHDAANSVSCWCRRPPFFFLIFLRFIVALSLPFLCRRVCIFAALIIIYDIFTRK